MEDRVRDFVAVIVFVEQKIIFHDVVTGDDVSILRQLPNDGHVEVGVPASKAIDQKESNSVTKK